MSDFQIFTDGSADIPLKTAEEKGIKIIPFYISFDSVFFGFVSIVSGPYKVSNI